MGWKDVIWRIIWKKHQNIAVWGTRVSPVLVDFIFFRKLDTCVPVHGTWASGKFFFSHFVLRISNITARLVFEFIVFKFWISYYPKFGRLVKVRFCLTQIYFTFLNFKSISQFLLNQTIDKCAISIPDNALAIHMTWDSRYKIIQVFINVMMGTMPYFKIWIFAIIKVRNYF